MAKLNWRTIGWLTLTALPMAAAAQFNFNATTDPNSAPHADLGGTPAFDLIHLDGLGPGVPLRKGNVIPGSERVQLNSLVLKAGADYGMDYPTGVVYLKRAIRSGDSLTVFYRYDSKAAAPAPEKINGIGTMKFDLIPGQFSMLAGMGMAERGNDGSVRSSNLFGFNSNFSNGGSKLNGLFLFSQKKKVDSQQLMGYQGAEQAQPTGNSSMVLQNFSSKIGKGNFEANYQDISSNFSDFGAAVAAGYDAGVVNQLAKEKGLKRMGFSFKDVNVGSMSLSQSFKSVKDGSNSIDWTTFGVKQGGFAFSFDSQHVDRGFNRFKDIAEADRAQLAKEAGMGRQNIGAEFTQKFGKVSFANNVVNDGAGGSIEHSELALDSTKFKFRVGDQTVSQSFSRITSMLPNEQAMYGAELGVHRQWMSLDANIGKDLKPLHFDTLSLTKDDHNFSSTDVSAGGKSWSLEHSERNVGKDFGAFGALNREADGHIKAIANMYQKDGIGIKPQDKGIFLSTPDIDRGFTRFAFSPAKDFDLTAERLEINSGLNHNFVDTLSAGTKKMNFKYRRESLAAGFDPNSLMLFERQQLGTLPGLNRTDMSMTLDIDKNKKLAITKTDAGVGGDSMSRQTFAYKDKGLDVQAGMRNVSPGFAYVNQLIDPEKDMLNSLIGFNERDVKITWQILPNLNFQAYSFDANSDTQSQQKRLRNLVLDWKPDSKTQVSYYGYTNHNMDPTAILFANDIQRFTFSHDFGRLGKVAYMHEKQSYDGTTTQLPDSDKQSFAYEAKIDNRTSVRTEETTTKYDNGDKEQTSANTISTELSKRVGVSVSDVKIDRPGTEQDQKKQNYGFWIDFGHGLRFNYGYARKLDGTVGFTQNQMSLTGGQFGNWNIGNGGYTSNYWSADQRTQSSTQFAIGTVKPIQLGFLRDVNVNLGWDTAADRSVWLKENKIFSFSSKVAGNQVGFDYRSHVLQSNQRGIDRAFTFKTDPNEKKWLRASIYYKVRSMPDGSDIMIRNMNFTARLTKELELTNSVITNPEQPNNNVVLGSIPLADRKNSWKLDYKPRAAADPYKDHYSFGASWDELINDQAHSLARTGGATFKIDFANAKSVAKDDPLHSSLTLYYGLEENVTNSVRRLAQRYSLQFDQRPGENQILSFLIGNISYEHTIADGFNRNNWTLRLDYQFKF